jgi:hypothetical protein
MTTRRSRPLLVLAALATLALSACLGGDDDDDGGSVSVFDLEEGDCVAEIDTLEGPEVSEVEVVDCDEDHQAEVFAVFDLEGDDDAPFPGEEEVSAGANEGCAEGFEDYIGIGPDESEFDISFLPPTQETWENEDLRDREVVCIAHRGGDTLDESVEDSEE